MLQRAVRTALRSRAARVGVILVLALVALAIVGPVVALHAPNANDFSLLREAKRAFRALDFISEPRAA